MFDGRQVNFQTSASYERVSIEIACRWGKGERQEGSWSRQLEMQTCRGDLKRGRKRVEGGDWQVKVLDELVKRNHSMQIAMCNFE